MPARHTRVFSIAARIPHNVTLKGPGSVTIVAIPCLALLQILII
jgi:hypothetical protein